MSDDDPATNPLDGAAIDVLVKQLVETMAALAGNVDRIISIVDGTVAPGQRFAVIAMLGKAEDINQLVDDFDQCADALDEAQTGSTEWIEE